MPGSAPPYAGEGPHALWHVSESASIGRFEPTVNERLGEALVWAIDTRHLPAYWFPRDCPRATFWADETTTREDAERFIADTSGRVHAIEGAWLDRMRTAQVFAYRLPDDGFQLADATAGYWVARQPVEPLERAALDDLLQRHAAAAIELRIVPTLRPLWQRVIASTLAFSGVRLRNARPPADR